jgi:hypothetical protein
MRPLLLFIAALLAWPVQARTILFVGNSFTFGAGSPVRRYRPDLVTDLNREGIGGVPALFRRFAEQAGLDWQVSLETSPGKPLWWHLEQKRALLARPWDVVVLQGYSLLDPDRPGDPTRHVAAAGELARLFRAANPNAEVDLVTTWARADQVLKPGSRWYGQTLAAMDTVLADASTTAKRRFPDIARVLPVGEAWSRAMRDGIADANPYDGLAFGKIDLWTWDQYHASAAGYYLEALVIFGAVTGLDPRTLGDKEAAAEDLGLSATTVHELQAVAAAELAQAGR